MKYIVIAMLILLSGCYNCDCHAEMDKEREREAMRASLGLVNVGAATVSNSPVDCPDGFIEEVSYKDNEVTITDCYEPSEE